MAKPTAFVDSSVLITALLSSTGGSFAILSQCHPFFAFQINEYVLVETQEILRTKFVKRPDLASDLFTLLGAASIVVLPDPSKREVTTAAKAISENDAPILASALKSSDYLITLDNEFLSERVRVIAKKKSLTILKPGDFLERFRAQRAG
jgi:predicted nucleic acid-binding protein